MKVKANVIVFSADSIERIDIRKLKEKKLQVMLDKDNKLPMFAIDNKRYIKDIVSDNLERIFENDRFYIEQLYTWGIPEYYTKGEELIVSYLAIVNKNCIKLDSEFNFYDINIKNIEAKEKLQEVCLSSNKNMFKYEIETSVQKKRNNLEYSYKLKRGQEHISELTAIIIYTGIKRLKNRIENTNIAFSFLEEEFTISELQQIYEIILVKKLIPANFRKKVEPMIKKTDKVVKESAYRPSTLYRFNEEFLDYWI